MFRAMPFFLSVAGLVMQMAADGVLANDVTLNDVILCRKQGKDAPSAQKGLEGGAAEPQARQARHLRLAARLPAAAPRL